MDFARTEVHNYTESRDESKNNPAGYCGVHKRNLSPHPLDRREENVIITPGQ